MIFQFTHHSSGLWKEALQGFYFSPTTANNVERKLRLPGGINVLLKQRHLKPRALLSLFLVSLNSQQVL